MGECGMGLRLKMKMKAMKRSVQVVKIREQLK
jgi:hypothetical protein